MDLIISYLNNIGNAIGWTLIHFLWQGLVLFLSYWAITRIFLRNKIHLQYWIGIVFISLCLVVPIREFILQLSSSSNINIIHQFSISIGAIQTNGLLSPFDMLIAIVQKIIPYLVIFWFISVTLICTNLTKSWFSLVKLSKESTIPIPRKLSDKLNFFSDKLKLNFKPIITISKKIDIPATFGYFKPVVLLPASLINHLPQEQMEAILLHEMCHIKRADFLHNILQLLIETLFFYHPLTKWISKDVRKTREQCCDELVLKLDANPMIYAKALTNIASIYNKITNNTDSSHIQIAANDGELLNRIKFLMAEKKPKSPYFTIGLSLLLSIFLLLIFNNLANNKLTQNSSIKSNFFEMEKPLIKNAIEKPGYLMPNIDSIIIKNINQNITKPDNNKAKTTFEIKQPLESGSLPIILPVKKEIANLNKAQPETIQILPEKIKPSITIDRNKNIEKEVPKQYSKSTYPKLLKRTNPIYKNSLRTMGIQGTVILSFNINKKGYVKDIQVDKSSPKKLLDGSARLALKKWRFDPSTININNINNRYQQIFSFTLDEEINNCKNANTGSRLNVKNLCSKK